SQNCLISHCDPHVRAVHSALRSSITSVSAARVRGKSSQYLSFKVFTISAVRLISLPPSLITGTVSSLERYPLSCHLSFHSASSLPCFIRWRWSQTLSFFFGM